MLEKKIETGPDTTQQRTFASHEEAIEKALKICQQLYSDCGRNGHEVKLLKETLENSSEHVRAGQFNVSVKGNKVYVCVSGNPNDAESAKLITEAWKKI